MPSLSKADCELVLKTKLGCDSFEFLGCEDGSADGISTGFLSSSGKVRIVYRRDGLVQEVEVFVKGLPDDVGHRENVLAMGCCLKEPLVYNGFLNKLEAKRDRPFFPRCYLARCDDVMVLKDLASKGYRNRPLEEDYDMPHVLAVVDSIARLHAASIAFEKKNACKMSKLIEGLNDDNIFRADEDHVGRKRFDVGTNALEAAADKYLSHVAEETRSKAFDFMRMLPYILGPSKKYRNVLCHTDLWNNNIMFKYDEDGGVASACLVDFQIATYKPPTFDLQLFLFNCTDREFRRKHYDEVMKYYYDQLRTELSDEGLDADQEITWSQLQEMSRETMPVSLASASQYMHFVGIPADLMDQARSDPERWYQFYQVDRNKIVLDGMDKCQIYRKKVIEGLKDLFEYFESL